MSVEEELDEDELRLLSLIAAAALNTPKKVRAFERWRDEDGTIDGLVRSGLIPEVRHDET